jgi:hypothetical protein
VAIASCGPAIPKRNIAPIRGELQQVKMLEAVRLAGSPHNSEDERLVLWWLMINYRNARLKGKEGISASGAASGVTLGVTCAAAIRKKGLRTLASPLKCGKKGSAPSRTRTLNLLIKSQLLCQLS